MVVLHHLICRPFDCTLGRMDGCNHSTIAFQDYLDHLIKTHKVVGSGKEESDDTFFIRQTFTESTKPSMCVYIDEENSLIIH